MRRRFATRSWISGCRRYAESYAPADRLSAMKPFYPLHARVCEHCPLVQLEGFAIAEEILSE